MAIKGVTEAGMGLLVRHIQSKVDKEVTYSKYLNKHGRKEYEFKSPKYKATFFVEITTAGAIVRLVTGDLMYKKNDIIEMESKILEYKVNDVKKIKEVKAAKVKKKSS